MMLWLVVVRLPAAPALTGRRELRSCGSARFVAASSCYGYNSRNCYDDVPCSGTCEGDGECGTSPYLNNCGWWDDVYERDCSPTQRPTLRPTPRPGESQRAGMSGDVAFWRLTNTSMQPAIAARCGALRERHFEMRDPASPTRTRTPTPGP